MPEGPEIRLAADSVEAVLAGRTIETVRFGLPRLRHHAKHLRGHRVLRLETRGKALLTHFENGLSIYSHNQLYGVWQVVRGHKLPESNRSLRLLLQTAEHSAILYSASDISVWPTAALGEHPFLRRIGPDIMDSNLHWREIAARVQLPRFAQRELAALYLDQAFLAGIGNYLRSEILHVAGLHPNRRPAELSRGERGALARATLTLSQRSYQTGGITLTPRLSGKLKSDGLSRGRRRFFVFGREDHPCYHCGSHIVRREISGRRLYYCTVCQPEDGRV
ncbi:MAG: endonuclease VIII [Halioglobus sp.]